MEQRERYDTVVIGGGQAGLAAGYYLKQARHSFRDPRGEGANRRQLAHPLGLAEALLAGTPRRPSGAAVPRAADVVPDRA